MQATARGGHAIGRHWTPAILRGAKTSLFLLLAVMVSSLIVVHSPRTTRAEGLLYTVKCTVGGLLGKQCERRAPEPGPVPPAPTVPTPPPPVSEPVVPAASPAPDPAPIVFQSEPIEPIQLRADEPAFVAMAELPNRYNYPAHILASAYMSGVLSGSTSHEPRVLEASAEGWRVLGLAWYWWIAMIGAVIGIAALIRSIVTKLSLSIVKPG